MDICWLEEAKTLSKASIDQEKEKANAALARADAAEQQLETQCHEQRMSAGHEDMTRNKGD